MNDDFSPTFSFKEFAIDDRRCALKTGTDGVLLGAWAELPCGGKTILDVGAGSGLICLMLAQRFADSELTGVEIDPDSVADMRRNIRHSPWVNRINAIQADFQIVEGCFDLIVSNPPFFSTGEKAPDASRARARHAGTLSPVSLIRYAKTHLATHGRLAMICPVENGGSCGELIMEAALCGLYPSKLTYIYTSPRRGVTRALIEFTTKASPMPAADMLMIGSEEYKSLTKDFYL